MEAQTASRSVLFADISESTRLYDTLGDEGGRRLVLECLELMKQLVERCGGNVVDRIGDELLCTFDDPASAGRASCELHRAIEAAKARFPAAVRIRIGFHHGPLVVDGNRVFGETIHIAKRVESLAKPQQTLTTRQAKDLIPPEEQLLMRFVDRTYLKGKSEPFELFEIVWDLSSATAEQSGRVPARVQPLRELLLDCGGETFTLDSAHPTLTIGRDPRADVVIDDVKVSRLHARIECRRDTFVFVDQSTNGSQVIDEHETVHLVRREECPLTGEGTIVLGSRVAGRSLPSMIYRLRWKDGAG